MENSTVKLKYNKNNQLQQPNIFVIREICLKYWQSQGSRSHHDFAYLDSQPMTDPRINFLHLTVSEIWPRQDFKGQGHWQGQRSNQGHTIKLHTYTLCPMMLPNTNFLHLMVSKIQPGQDFKGQVYDKVNNQIKVT